MSSADPRIPNCRHCHHYQVEGRRGGSCQKLNVGVQGSWSACPLAIAAFAQPVDPIARELASIVSPIHPAFQNDIVLIDTLISGEMDDRPSPAVPETTPRATSQSGDLHQSPDNHREQREFDDYLPPVRPVS